MRVSSFLKLVEIQTKVASVIPFALGTAYAVYRFNQFNVKNFFLMFISLISFDMVTTAINNYLDYKKANKTYGYGYESHNAIVRDKLKESDVVMTIFALLLTATAAGFMLYLNTNIVVLLLGMVSFLVGILYTFGPVPISRMPLGEIFSGFFMGFIIIFISTYIHVYNTDLVNILYEQSSLLIKINVKELILIFLVSLPAVVGIANIMLANNICDVEDDIENKRYTLPIYIGRDKALNLFRALYYIAYVDIMLLILLKISPVFSFLILLTIIPVYKNIKVFMNKQTKKDTFVTAVQNFVLMNIPIALIFGIGIII
ncbi:1,4-dihydroxy-2-naphthoate polyprenyltransferase [Defluviitalea saccharophila]|uniref:1,4-dihydroxy-2-naphthoate polyprenyltransferase n=1 Tax=Defluviitalea saccharophila TaxID=879970 RepID=A0ABZ2Y6F0_9FIRM|nr:1,4-dihydroxy-2-naphthoate polyprenyltransferase [Candidatus Epulonipiscium sp.]